jgi:RNA polymerase sigma-70 factor (ECF subfamily)
VGAVRLGALTTCPGTSPEDAEDAVQETLWAAARTIQNFRRAASITTWLFTIVRHACHRMVSHREKEPTNDVTTLMDEGLSVEDEAIAREMRGLLSLALGKRVPDLRSVARSSFADAANSRGFGFSRLARRPRATKSEVGVRPAWIPESHVRP